ncbi:MAG: type IV secretory system conjugative DNA transfer family protein [Oligoflexus sp.]
MSYFVARLCYIREVFRGGLREVKNFVFIHPFVKVHSYTFRRGVLALGAIGSGKTNLIYNWFLRPFLSGRTRFLVYDQKGDFSAALGLRDDAVVVSPFLENSAAWWVAKDLDTSTKMVEFLTILGSFDELRESKFFNTAFTDFGTAVFLELKGSKKLDWTFKDLFEMMQDQVRLFEVVKRHRPQAEMFARRDEEIDQARGVLGTIREKLLKIEPIARAWQSGQERFSLSEFFDAGYSGDKRILIVLGKSRYENVNRGFSTSFLEEAIKLLIDAPEGDLDVVVSIDELQTLSRIPSLVTLPRVGRSKGVRLHVGTQDFAVTKKQYERDGGFEGMDNTFKTRFVGSLAGSQVSDEASAMFRKVNKEVWRRDPKTRRFVAHKELNQPALVSGQLSLPEPSLKDPAYFYFKHSDWPILKIAYRIEPLPQNGFEPVPAKWLDDSDFASALGSDDAELEDPEEISISLDGADAGKKRGGGGVKKKASSSSEDGRSPGHGKSSSGDGEASSASKDRGSGDKASLGETSAEPSSSSLKKKGRRSGIKIKKFRR